uniref:C2H2-type domain-containing protein n=1 Tax=Timema genevievae TaxID=629358 RepID=A0A7R9JTI0_TIMGE|nr:unnamed protein product [Timema genevievae]
MAVFPIRDGDMAQLVFLCETRLSTSPDVAAVGTQTETKGLFDNRGGGKNQFTTAPEGDTGKLPFLPPTGVLLAQDTTGTPVISSDSGAGIGSFTSCSDGTSSKRTYMPAQDAASTSLTPLDGVTSKGQFMVGLSLSGQDGAAGELQFTAVQAGAAGEVQFTTVPASGSRFMMSGPPTDSMLSTEGLGYVCKICGKAFRRQNSCYDHMAYHQGTTRCTVCNVMLSRKGNMKRHMRMVHGITEEPPQGSESLGNLSGVEWPRRGAMLLQRWRWYRQTLVSAHITCANCPSTAALKEDSPCEVSTNRLAAATLSTGLSLTHTHAQ